MSLPPSLYCYSSLPEGSIRLLRLLPHQDEHAPIQCQLFEFALADYGSTRPYEALSYVWGSETKPRSLSIDSYDLPVGENLYAALSHLRDCSLERIIWVDAVCINQRDTKEKGTQVQSMAKIYAKASGVIVWLGEATPDSCQAIEEIRIAAEQRMKLSINDLPDRSSGSNISAVTMRENTFALPAELSHLWRDSDEKQISDPSITKSAILGLLERPWFQRIWVLQEVAAARHVLIKCGPTEIDGYAFCSGLSALNVSYKANSDLRPLIRSVAYLIRGAAFRSRSATSRSGRFSLDICSLGELVDIYHTRKATDRRDKVYALLGMSSDDTSIAGLSANYEISWGQLFQQLVNFFFSERVSVDTWDYKEMAVIRGKYRVLGEVFEVSMDGEGRQHMDIRGNKGSGRRQSRWTIQASAKSVQAKDVICLVQGASMPTIIRLCNGYWAVVTIAVPLPGDLRLSGRVKAEPRPMVRTFPHNLLLVWNWDMYPDESHDREACEQVMGDPVSLHPKAELEGRLDKVIRLRDTGVVLEELARDHEAWEYLRKAMEIFEGVVRSMDCLKLACPGHGSWRKGHVKKLERMVGLLLKDKDGWMPLCLAAESGQETMVKMLLGGTKIQLNAEDMFGRTPLSLAAQNGHEAIVKLLLGTGKVKPDARTRADRRTPLSLAAENGHETIVKLLLGTGRVNPDIKDETYGMTPLSFAAKNGHEAIVNLLMGTGKVDLNARDGYDRTPLWLAAETGHEAIVKMLLGSEKVDPNAPDGRGLTPLWFAVENGQEAIIKMLVGHSEVDPDIGAGFFSQTPLLLAAEKGHEGVIKLLLSTGKVNPGAQDRSGQTPLLLAAERGHEGIVRLLLDTGKTNLYAKDIYGRTPLSLAAENGHEAIVKLLQST